MKKQSKAARVAVLVKLLLDAPLELVSLGALAARLGVAKSSISEDVSAIRQGFEAQGLGKLETVTGVCGGVRYVPYRTRQYADDLVASLCRRLKEPARRVSPGYLYLDDILHEPSFLAALGEVIAARFAVEGINAVVTVEARGIPLAMAVARYLNKQLVIARRELVYTHGGVAVPATRQESFIADGPLLSVSYVSGSQRNMQSMSLPRRILPEKARVLVVDDFLRAGGTLRALTALLHEFQATVVGAVVLVETARPLEKLTSGYLSVVRLDEVLGEFIVAPGNI
ncbi:MAG: Pur operon repressor [Firmicutes bacterium]|nr:Pur operon repressor [Bacillota bacterium]MBT9152013.1 Pur operon repressor [Bacillota bacterium]MBT9157686.1 Pur operon repressor [Bacillota bacterium]